MEFNAAGIALALTGILTLFLFTYLYRENFLFRLAEHIIIGSFTGHAIIMGIKSIQETGVARVTGGDVTYVIPLILGLLFFSSLIKQYAWLARYPLAVGIGVTAAVEASTRFQAYIVKRTIQTISTPLTSINSIIIFLTCLSVLTYFIYTLERKEPLKTSARIGRIALMATFGLTIAFDVASRAGNLTARALWLFETVPDITIVTTVIIAAWIVYENRARIVSQ